MDIVIMHSLNAVVLGFIIFILAAGLSLTLGTMGIVNLAHGAFFMVAAYVGWAVGQRVGNFALAALAGIVAGGLLGLLLERGFLRHLHKLFNAQVLVTFGFIYILTNLCFWVWGPYAQLGVPPAFLSGVVNIGRFGFSVYRFAIIFVGLALAVGLWFFQEKTRIGAIVRAGMDDKEMTVGIGINYERVCTAVFCLGASMAAFAGVIALPVLGANLESGLELLLLALSVVIIGGVGSVQGALAGSMVIATAKALSIVYFPGLDMFTMYLLLVIVLLFRPSGLLGRKEI